MPWTLTLHPPKEPELLNAYLLAVGKALCLANNFESRCSYFAQFIAFTDAIEAGTPCEERRAATQRAAKLHLARTIKVIEAAEDISEKHSLILTRARESRNFIAHQSAAIGELSAATDRQLLRRLAELYPHVLAVAAGDNLVSAWEYEVSEKEPAPRTFMETYVEQVLTWVYGPALSKARNAA